MHLFDNLMIKAISPPVQNIINSSPAHSLSDRCKPLSSFPWTSVITSWPRSTTCWGPESTWRRPPGEDWRRWANTSNTWQRRATSCCSPAAPHSSAVQLLINAGGQKKKPYIHVVFSDVYFPEWGGACARVHPQLRGVPLLWCWTES